MSQRSRQVGYYEPHFVINGRIETVIEKVRILLNANDLKYKEYVCVRALPRHE